MNNKSRTLNQQVYGVTESKQTKRKSLTKIILDEEIYKLREQGLSYMAIANHFKEKGTEVSYQTIRKKCKKIYELKGQKETEIKDVISDEKIYELREQGLSYMAITNHFKEQGIEISYEIIRKRCKKIYELKDKKEPKTKRGTEQKIMITDEEIYELREQGLTYRAIAKYFKEQGIEISYEIIRKRCKKIYKLKDKEEPKIKRKTKQKIRILDEEIYELREKGLTYIAIANYFKAQGTEVSYQTIRRRCKQIYKIKEKDEPKFKRETKQKIMFLDEEICKLREQGLSYKAIANYFKEKGIEISHVTVMRKCKKIYELKEKKETEVGKSELDSLEEKLQKAIEKKKEIKRLLEYYKKLEKKLQQEKNGEEHDYE